NTLNLMEFLPIGDRNAATEAAAFPSFRYPHAHQSVAQEVQAQLNTAPRPLVYVPVNARQAAIARKHWIESDDLLGKSWSGPLLDLRFPPQTYDAYVLISVGPGGTTGGVVAE